MPLQPAFLVQEWTGYGLIKRINLHHGQAILSWISRSGHATGMRYRAGTGNGQARRYTRYQTLWLFRVVPMNP
jgi:hypothetical protein